MRHFISLWDIDPIELGAILNISHQVKQLLRNGVRPSWLPRTVLAMIFEKPSLRTRVSFEAGISQLGGNGLYLGKDVGWPDRESTADFIRVLAEYADWVVCRLRSHAHVEELASHDCIPVINGLTDREHPCQALGDLLTMQESVGDLAGKTLTFVGDGNNVAQSLAQASAIVGMKFRLLGPPDYWFGDCVLDPIHDRYQNADILQTSIPKEALQDADFVYTDVWTSMGQESESTERIKAFATFQVNDQLLAHAPNSCRILHCLPAKRGQEITDQVIDSPNSLIVSQAGNRMHAQKGLLLWLSLQHGKLDAAALERDGVQM